MLDDTLQNVLLFVCRLMCQAGSKDEIFEMFSIKFCYNKSVKHVQQNDYKINNRNLNTEIKSIFTKRRGLKKNACFDRMPNQFDRL